MPLDSTRAFSIAYTPGVAQVSPAIAVDPALAQTHTWASRLVVVVSRRPLRCGRSGRPPRFSEPDQQRAGLPGVFRGALDSGAKRITPAMKIAAAAAIADLAGGDLAADFIVPSALDPRVGPGVAAAAADTVRR